MYSLAQSLTIKGSSGEAIPHPFKGLTRHEVEFLRGSVSLAAAGPGTGKSLFAANFAMSANVPTLYFSADSGPGTQLSRATAIITGDDVREIKAQLSRGQADEHLEAWRNRWWIQFVYEAHPDLARLELEIACYAEVFGVYPALIIIDNITNIDVGAVGSAESYTFGLEGMCEYLQEMARDLEAHVLALHHVKGEYADGLSPIPLSGVKGQISRVPAVVLTIHKEIDGMGGRVLNVSPVKNREGFEDSSGETYSSYDLDRTNLRLVDLVDEF